MSIGRVAQHAARPPSCSTTDGGEASDVADYLSTPPAPPLLGLHAFTVDMRDRVGTISGMLQRSSAPYCASNRCMMTDVPGHPTPPITKMTNSKTKALR